MSFIPSLFSKVADTVTTQVQSAVGGFLNDASSELASALFKVGSGFDAIVNMSSLKSDSLVSGGANEFFSSQGTATDRVSAQQISQNRVPEGSSTNPAFVMDQGNVGVLQFPPDMGKFSIKFDFKDYKRPDPMRKATYQTTSTVVLPIPHDLNETHAVGWNSSETGLVGALADIAVKANSGDNTANSIMSALGGAAGQAGRALASRYGLRFLNEDAFNTVGQFLGAIPNPNLSMFFEGPTFQTHTFKWTFHPMTPSESDNIRSIVNEFRKKMLPSIASSGGSNILNYPSMVEVTLLPADYLYPMKRAIVESINVNYAPRGFPTFFKGTSAPTFIEFEVHLKAIEYFLAEDFGGTGRKFNTDDILNVNTDAIGNALKNALGIGGNG